jgi:ribosomal protein S18 acetylase RimI-like enzyme
MIIKLVHNASERLSEFDRREWALANEEHYGRLLDWQKSKYILEATEDAEVVGALFLDIEMGVAHVLSLIVSHDRRGLGIGKALLQEAESVARQRNAHKIYLETGKTWDAVPFYEASGYRITGELLDHYLHEDFVEMTKVLL